MSRHFELAERIIELVRNPKPGIGLLWQVEAEIGRSLSPEAEDPTYAVMDAARNEWWSAISKRGDPARLTSSLGSFGDGFFAGWRASRTKPQVDRT